MARSHGGNTVHSSPKMLFRYDFPEDAASGNTAGAFAAGSWRDFPDLTRTPTLTKTSILLVHYQISVEIGAASTSPVGLPNAHFLACRLMIGGTEETAARSIVTGVYDTSSGTWIGAVSAGSPVIKVQCRNSYALDLHHDYMTKALTVAILG